MATCLAIAIISGTSADGIDTVLVRLTEQERLNVALLAGQTFPYPADLRQEILALCACAPRTLPELCCLDDRIAEVFAQCALQLLAETGYHPDQIAFLASHGQTVWHRPPTTHRLGYSWQMGRGAVIARKTGITTIANFRKADIEQGGQGAPLVPMLDWLLFTDSHEGRVAQNIGGIANLTYLPAQASADQVLGFDNAPGNVLIDLAMQTLFQQNYDAHGQIARSGRICEPLVSQWLGDSFLQAPPPKSTGREWFSPTYLRCRLEEAKAHNLEPQDIIATLTEFTARAIAQSYSQFLPAMPQTVIVSGGGSRNDFLLERLKFWLGQVSLVTSDRMGIPSDFKEAIAFAVLGYLRLHNRPGNLPRVTGARKPVALGEIFT
jgi:anhydro-N-acetylmuramic acid kinase